MKTLGLVGNSAVPLRHAIRRGADAAEKSGKTSSHGVVPGAAVWEDDDAVAILLNPQSEETGRVSVVEAADGLLLRLQAQGPSAQANPLLTQVMLG